MNFVFEALPNKKKKIFVKCCNSFLKVLTFFFSMVDIIYTIFVLPTVTELMTKLD